MDLSGSTGKGGNKNETRRNANVVKSGCLGGARSWDRTEFMIDWRRFGRVERGNNDETVKRK